MKSYEKLLVALALIAIAVLVTGVNRCQESYNFAAQAKVATPEATDDGTITRTPTPVGTNSSRTPTATPNGTGTATPDPDATETPEPTETPPSGASKPEPSAGNELLLALSKIGHEDGDEKSAGGSKGAAAAGQKPSNWLGKGFTDDQAGDARKDSDGDGYSDALEVQSGTDPADAQSAPQVIFTSVLAARLDDFDDDADGIPNNEENSLGSDPTLNDSDGDGSNDGAEVRSGTDLLDPKSMPKDTDHDGLSDEYEKARGLNMRNLDTDGDGLRDDQEYALGSDPLNPDSDGDGIFDGKETSVGSDPTKAE